ncbi:ester cyclase [Marivita hallyeonensis]|uniref:SnoaL-like domain-containing protein n=1 Tax=Marivita hallyeonensis TaxID=996342 RepID=A0A1M5TZA4_9RHOB|nr:nuclear transport factor 2 family protein [Marivita hallyeonensis]SHH56024.1 SnoaL-like domain-containing protein [Marivita hallyeonensis]
MPGFQSEKQLVRDYYAALSAADHDALPIVMAKFCAPDLVWRGYHPVGLLNGAETVATTFWQPLKHALTSLQRRTDLFFAGRHLLADDGAVWVASMGHLMGLFDQPLFGILPTGKVAMLRYGTFHKVENGKIIEEAMYFDLPHLMVQTGQNPFPPQTAQHLVQPGPMTHGGLLFDDAPEAEGRATLAAIEAMISDLGSWNLGIPLEEELRRTWHEDMIWWGPEGIGATYTIPRYAQQHSGPFRAAFTNRSATGHICRTAEGHYGGFFGWPNFTAEHTGGFMGMPATPGRVEFRVIDFYRREGDKLAENWIFIDLLHVWAQQGVDILKRTTEIG